MVVEKSSKPKPNSKAKVVKSKAKAIETNKVELQAKIKHDSKSHNSTNKIESPNNKHKKELKDPKRNKKKHEKGNEKKSSASSKSTSKSKNEKKAVKVEETQGNALAALMAAVASKDNKTDNTVNQKNKIVKQKKSKNKSKKNLQQEPESESSTIASSRKRPRKNEKTESELILPSHQEEDDLTEKVNVKPKIEDKSSTNVSEDGSENCSTGRWTKQEDDLLKLAVEKIGARNWKRVAAEFLENTRSDVQCLHRWQKVLRPGLVKGPWTKEEDETILRCRQQGITKWSEIARHVTGRIGKQCRERWFNHLDPSIRKCEWTEEEDRKLIEGQALLGNKWSQIAKLFLPGRPENAVKNRWNAATRRRRISKKKTDGAKKKDDKPKKPRAPRTTLTKTQQRFQSLKPSHDLQQMGDAMEGMVSLAMTAALFAKADENMNSVMASDLGAKGEKRSFSSAFGVGEEKPKRNGLKVGKHSGSFSESRPHVPLPALLNTKTESIERAAALSTPTVQKAIAKSGLSLSPSLHAGKKKETTTAAYSTVDTANALAFLSRGFDIEKSVAVESGNSQLVKSQ